MTREQEFHINEFLTVRLEEPFTPRATRYQTVIYVGGRYFRQCKFLLLDIPIDKVSSLDEIDSIDEAAEKLDKSQEPVEGYEPRIPPEVEFWGHCSNLQVWYENDYDTRLLHSNLAFPLLKRLTDAGDPLAKRVFKEEIAKRLAKGYKPAIEYLRQENYLRFLNHQEILFALLDPKEAEIIVELEQKINFEIEVEFEIHESKPNYLIPKRKHVELIYLDKCGLETVPIEVKELKFLEDISLASNQITEIPEWLFKLENLRYINLAGNNITYIPTTINTNKIEYLDISYNPLKNPAKINQIYKNIKNLII